MPDAAISPRWIFFWVFGWLAAQGRFTSLFLEERGLDEEEIGALLSVTGVLSIVAGPLLCNLADRLVAEGNQKAYEMVIAACVVLTTIIFCLHSLPELGVFNPSDDFVYFMSLRVLYSMAISAVFPLVDSIALKYLIDSGMDKSAFGQERLYGAYGWAVVSFALGLFIDYFKTRVMYIFIVVLMGVLLCALYIFATARVDAVRLPLSDLGNQSCVEMTVKFMPLSLDETSHNDEGVVSEQGVRDTVEPGKVDSSGDGFGERDRDWRECITSNPNWIVLRLMLSSPIAVMFVLCHTILSGVTSIVENLVFLFFKDSLGASNLVMGFSVVVTVVFEIPMFAYSTQLLDAVGQHNLLIIACVSYCVRVIGYTLAPNGIWVLLVEPLHGVTYASSKMATVDFVSDIAPDHMQASAQGVLASLSALGRLVAIATGGYVAEHVSSAVLYRGSAAIMMLTMTLFISTIYISNYCYKRNSTSVDEEQISRPEVSRNS